MREWLKRIVSLTVLRGVTITTVLGALTWLYTQWSTSELQTRTQLKQLMDSFENLQTISEQLRQPCTATNCRQRFSELFAQLSANHYQFVHSAQFLLSNKDILADVDFVDDFFNPSKQHGGRISDFRVLPVQAAVLQAREALQTPYVDSGWCTEDRRAAIRVLTESLDVYRYCRGKVRKFAEEQAAARIFPVSPEANDDCRDSDQHTFLTSARIRDMHVGTLDNPDRSAPWLFDSYCSAAGLSIAGGIIPLRTEQLLVVTSDSWTSTKGWLTAYIRKEGGTWKPLHAQIAVVLGKAGLGWGHGLLPIPVAADGVRDPYKREGDGRSPAGLFPLGSVFSDPSMPPAVTRMRSVVTNDSMYCDDRSDSNTYNQAIPFSRHQAKECANAEEACPSEPLRRKDGVYKRFIWVKYNSNPTIKHAGSCIFVHLNHDDLSPTVGCTTVSPQDMEWLLNWLDKSKYPLLLQLPRTEFEKRRADLGL